MHNMGNWRDKDDLDLTSDDLGRMLDEGEAVTVVRRQLGASPVSMEAAAAPRPTNLGLAQLVFANQGRPLPRTASHVEVVAAAGA